MFLVMFPGVAKLGNICFGRKLCVREAKMLLTPDKNIFCLMSSKICFRNTCFPARLNWETFASATMFPRRCFLVYENKKINISHEVLTSCTQTSLNG